MSTYQVIEHPDGHKSLDFIQYDCKIVTDKTSEAERIAQSTLDRLDAVALVTAPVFSLPEKVSNLNATTTFTAQAEAKLAYTTIAKYLMTVPELSIADQEFTSGSLSFTVPNSVSAGTVLHVIVQAVDSRGNVSGKTTHTTTVGTAQVLAPSIVIPADGAEVDVQSGVVSVQSSAFATAGDFSDTHAASDWQLASNVSMTAIVQQALNSSDLVAHNFTGLSLDNGATYYLRARHKGTQSGWGSFGSISTFKAKSAITTPGGRLAYRADDDKGSVVVCNIWVGDEIKEVHLKVWDAQYRATKTWCVEAWDGTQWVELALPEYKNTPTAKFDGSSSNITTTIAAFITDTQLNNLFSGDGKHDANTGKQNTDRLIELVSNADAAYYCRSLGADLGNMQEMAVVYCEADFLDTMDSTVGSYPDNALSGWRIGGKVAVWSSTYRSSGGALDISYAGWCSSTTLNNILGVIPVQELSI